MPHSCVLLLRVGDVYPYGLKKACANRCGRKSTGSGPERGSLRNGMASERGLRYRGSVLVLATLVSTDSGRLTWAPLRTIGETIGRTPRVGPEVGIASENLPKTDVDSYECARRNAPAQVSDCQAQDGQESQEDPGPPCRGHLAALSKHKGKYTEQTAAASAMQTSSYISAVPSPSLVASA